MADEAVRRLARVAGRTREPSDVLALARALTRSGRDVEALDALLAVPDDPSVSAELETFAAWAVPEASGGRTSCRSHGPPRARTGSAPRAQAATSALMRAWTSA